MNNKTYDILKWVAIIALPAASTFISVVFKIWNIPNGDAIAQTITAAATCLGALLCVSNSNYKKLEENDTE